MPSTYQNIVLTKSSNASLLPSAQTGTHLFRTPPTKDDEEGKKELNIFYWARATARSFFVRAISTFLYATGLLAFLAFLTTIGGSNKTQMYVSALSVVINAVATTHYRWIGKIRGSMWMAQSGTPKWENQNPIVMELIVDAIRHSDWLVRARGTRGTHARTHARARQPTAALACRARQITMIFLTFKIYRMINKPFEDYDGVFQSVEAAAATAAIMILLGAYARLGTDEMWDVRNLFTLVTGFVAYAGSVVCLILLLVDLSAASHDIEGGYLQRSFFLAWIGYPLVGMVGVGYRLGMACFGNDTYAGEIPEAVSVFKARAHPPFFTPLARRQSRLRLAQDVAFGLLDVWCKGVFALYTAHVVFGETLFNVQSEIPYNWATA